MNDDTPGTSADQDAWVALAEQVRSEIGKAAGMVGAMNPTELKTFVEAVDAAYWFHARACLWDKRLELEMAKISAD